MEEEKKALNLTEEEALGLLELALTSMTEMNADQRSALLKLSSYCKNIWRQQSACAQPQENAPKECPSLS